jgi:NADPH:quinone reductase
MVSLPSQMRAVFLRSFSGPLSVESIPVPPLKEGQVLIKMAAAPINPSDLVFLRNLYGIKKPLPVVPGLEGAGRVVAGRGLWARALIGHKVASHAPEDGNGTWAEYMACPASTCVPLLPSVTEEQGASLIVNPLTALALLDIVKRGNHRAFVQTAAAGAVGRMIGRSANRAKISAINIVRRPEQAALLRKEGQAYVLDSSADRFEEHLQSLCRTLNVRIALDAVGGELTGQISGALAHGGRVIVYGALGGGQACAVSPSAIIFDAKQLEGFWLTRWMKSLGKLHLVRLAYRAQKRLHDDLQTRVQGRCSLDQINEAIALYKAKRSDGKVLIIP